MRVFLAHAKGSSDIHIQHLCSLTRSYFRHRDGYNTAEVEVVAGVDDFNANIGNDGTFDAWARGVATRRDTFTGQRVYDAIVVPGREMGKATGIIAMEALSKGLEVYSIEEYGEDQCEMYVADGVEEENPNDYFRGWRLLIPGGDYDGGF